MVKDIVVIGSAISDIVSQGMPALKTMPPGDVRGFDVRTGEQRWIFHTIPRDGEFGNDTWLTAPTEDRASWEYTGNTNMWAWPSADEELGYVYLPLSTPTNDYYCGAFNASLHRSIFARMVSAPFVQTNGFGC